MKHCIHVYSCSWCKTHWHTNVLFSAKHRHKTINTNTYVNQSNQTLKNCQIKLTLPLSQKKPRINELASKCTHIVLLNHKYLLKELTGSPFSKPDRTKNNNWVYIIRTGYFPQKCPIANRTGFPIGPQPVALTLSYPELNSSHLNIERMLF